MGQGFGWLRSRKSLVSEMFISICILSTVVDVCVVLKYPRGLGGPM